MGVYFTSNMNKLLDDHFNLLAEVKKEDKKSLKFVAKFGKKLAKKFAPRLNGNLKQGIRSYHNKKSAVVISSVPGNFPYNYWVNGTIPVVPLKFPFGTGVNVMYGDPSARTPSGRPYKWKQPRGYFEQTYDLMKTMFGKQFHVNRVEAFKKWSRKDMR